jgi:acyl carrier protein
MKNDLKQKIELREQILNRVKEMIITEVNLTSKPEDLDPDTPLFATGLALDSIDAVSLVVGVEKEFNISLNQHESMEAMRTINTLVDTIINRIQPNDE